jgi:hypothetical protein
MAKRVLLAGLVSCGLLLAVAAAKAKAKTAPQVETPPQSHEKVISFLTETLMAAENWMWPNLPVQISVLDTVLSLDTCAAYRKGMGKNKHPWLQVNDDSVNMERAFSVC